MRKWRYLVSLLCVVFPSSEWRMIKPLDSPHASNRNSHGVLCGNFSASPGPYHTPALVVRALKQSSYFTFPYHPLCGCMHSIRCGFFLSLNYTGLESTRTEGISCSHANPGDVRVAISTTVGLVIDSGTRRCSIAPLHFCLCTN